MLTFDLFIQIIEKKNFTKHVFLILSPRFMAEAVDTALARRQMQLEKQVSVDF